jgi:hypothetical protein
VGGDCVFFSCLCAVKNPPPPFASSVRETTAVRTDNFPNEDPTDKPTIFRVGKSAAENKKKRKILWKKCIAKFNRTI